VRAKTDRLDTGLLMRAVLGWLRGEAKHRNMAAIRPLRRKMPGAFAGAGTILISSVLLKARFYDLQGKTSTSGSAQPSSAFSTGSKVG